jgi:hypothetical protein
MVKVTLGLSPAAATHSEHVTVTSARRPSWPGRGVGAETSIARSTFAQSNGGLVDDPIRAVHALPRVSVPDDFHTDFVVRGSPFRHVEVVVDGVATTWLQHTAYGRSATGSLTMLSSHIVDDATLRVGAYPRRSSDRLGAELELTLREGSRERVELRGVVGSTSATVVGEGPLGRSVEGARGSWLVAARQSFQEWPAGSGSSARTAFGFSDGVAKLVYDVRPAQRVGVTVLGGISSVDDDEMPGGSEHGGATSGTTVASIFWRSSFAPSVVLTQRAYLVKRRVLATNPSGQEAVRGANDELAYRADVARPMFGGLLEGGARIGRTSLEDGPGAGDGSAGPGLPVESSWHRSAYVHFTWAATRAFTLSPGVRVAASTLAPQGTVTRWILGEYALRPRWSLNATAGVSYQAPGLDEVHRRPPGLPRLRSERATHLDVSLAHQAGQSVRWQATVFTREETDILREPDVHSRLVDDVMIDPAGPALHANSLAGSSRGVELVVNRKSDTGLSGWAAYSYGRTRYTDVDRRETFWADLDQRHTLNLFGMYRLSSRSILSATFRAGSGFPIPAYVGTRDDGVLVVSDRRNDVRLPPYARLDVRASRTFQTFGRRLTVFGEAVNVLNRANVGLARGTIVSATGEAAGFTSTMLRRRASVGILVEF